MNESAEGRTPVPPAVWVFGLSTIIPFFIASGLFCYGPGPIQKPALLALLAYSAAMVSYFGGVRSGLEIENPRLVDSGDIGSLGWLKRTKEPEHTEFRDDRFVAAFDFFGDEGRRGSASKPSATVAYLVRAVTPGSFMHPAATVEDMYRPDRFARTASGRLEVTARDQR